MSDAKPDVAEKTYEDLLLELCQADERVVVMTAENRAAIRGLPDKLGARFIDVGICEQTMIGAAAGLALRGRRPVTHALACFLTMRAFEFIRTDVGIGELPVKLIGGVPGFLSTANGPTHQAIEDIALMRGIPGMQVFCPADYGELLEGMPQVIDSDAPVYVRFNDRPAVVAHGQPLRFGEAEQIGDGADVTILTYGFLLEQALQARTLLARWSVNARVLNMRTLAPVDEGAIARAARDTRQLVTFEDHFLSGGLYSIVCETLVRNQLRAPVLPIALDKRWFKPALLDDVLAHEGFSAEKVAERIFNVVRERTAA